MTRIDQLNSRRAVVIATAVATLAIALLATLALPGTGAAAPAQSGGGSACPDADQPAAESTPLELRRSVRCLINFERALHGRTKLARAKPLQKAAQHHTEVMVETDCLAHQCGGEAELADRVAHSGYLDGADAWQFAESTGCGVSARAMVENWIATRFHRINLLDKTYGDIGVGVVQEPVAERCDEGFATFAVVFGWRTPEPEPVPAS